MARTRRQIRMKKNEGGIHHKELQMSPSKDVTPTSAPETSIADNNVNKSPPPEDAPEDNMTPVSPVQEEMSSSRFNFQGVSYNSYEEMVQAKRKRNADMLISSGLLEASSKLREQSSGNKSDTSKQQLYQRGLKRAEKRKQPEQPLGLRRKSSRIAGVKSDGYYIEDERSGGKYIVAVEGGKSNTIIASNSKSEGHTIEEDDHYRNRVNNGEDLSVKEAVEHSGSKWVKDDSVTNAESFLRCAYFDPIKRSKTETKSQPSKSMQSQVDALTIDDTSSVAKVTPDRIYAVAFHPSPHQIISVAGDKKGHIGFWHVNAEKPNDQDVSNDSSNNDNQVYLFKPHNGAVANLEWSNDGSKLTSFSYDSTIRVFNAKSEKFVQVFAAYDDDASFSKELGYGLDLGYRFWTQYGCHDSRNEDCLFVTTSMGSLLHLDLRQKGSITFNQNVSEKKVNTVSLHPDGNVVATCGLDCTVKLWDVRKFKAPSKKGSASPSTKAIFTHQTGKSTNSAFFSPSGNHLLCTTMSDKVEILTKAHLSKGKGNDEFSLFQSIRHNNQTGRWLSTFMAQWHPMRGSGSSSSNGNSDEMFVVGCMKQPRTIELFNGLGGNLMRGIHGDVLTAVASRCCFHPSTEQLIVMGGNSSGRVVISK